MRQWPCWCRERAQVFKRERFGQDVHEADDLAQIPGILLEEAAAGDHAQLRVTHLHHLQHVKAGHASRQGQIQHHDPEAVSLRAVLRQEHQCLLTRAAAHGMKALGLQHGQRHRQHMWLVIHDEDAPLGARMAGGIR
jgi:hypothetical protein